MKKKKTARKLPPLMDCDCGGKLQPAILGSHDILDYIGLPGTIDDVPGFRCSRCKGETLEGEIVNHILKMSALRIATIPTRLPAEAARFLRRVVGVTQKELATRMNVDRVTVAKWECGEQPISSHHDAILRLTAVVPLINSGLIPEKDVAAVLATFGAVRIAAPEPMQPISLGSFPTQARRQAASHP